MGPSESSSDAALQLRGSLANARAWARVHRSISGLIEQRAKREVAAATGAATSEQSATDIDDQLAELRDLPPAASEVFVDLMRDLLRSRPEQRGERGRGRPPRAQSVDREVLLASPMPELQAASAGEARELVRQVNDPQRLIEAYAFAAVHDRRRSVLTALRDLQRLGVAPEDFDPPPSDSHAAPWSGYESLAITSASRPEIRSVLRARSESELHAALDYEIETKRRVGMIAALSSEILRRGTARAPRDPRSEDG